MKGSRSAILALALPLFAAAGLSGAAYAQSAANGGEAYDAELRGELQRIIEEDPANADKAKKALSALDSPAGKRESRGRRETGRLRIVNGLPAHSHPAVGALIKGETPETAITYCTVTLVGCDKVLTAAHCIARDPNPASYFVYFQDLGFSKVKDIRWEKAKFASPYYDIAMLTLEKPVEGIAPMPINASVTPLNNSVATIVGFGRTGGSRQDYGIKREGSVRTRACPADYANKQVICWNFDAEVKSSGSAQNTCNADSGGGIFMMDKDGSGIVEKIFAIVTGGTDADCVRDDLSYNVDVFKYRDWIAAAGERRLSSAMCGRPLWTSPDQAPKRTTVRIDASKPRASISFDVPDGVAALRVSMNAEDDNFKKNLFQFSASTSKDGAGGKSACASNGTGQYAFCTIEKPESGSWTVSVTRKKGQGEVQITTLLVR